MRLSEYNKFAIGTSIISTAIAAAAAGAYKYYELVFNNPSFSPFTYSYNLAPNLFDKFFNEVYMPAIIFGSEIGALAGISTYLVCLGLRLYKKIKIMD